MVMAFFHRLSGIACHIAEPLAMFRYARLSNLTRHSVGPLLLTAAANIHLAALIVRKWRRLP